MPDVQKKMQDLLDVLVAHGNERGVQLVAYLNGKCVVDAFAGVADAASGKPVTADTLFPVFSVSKAMAATLVHLAVERGRISYDTPVAEVWPGFAAEGKGNIHVRHVLSHTAGLQHMPMGLSPADLMDWNGICRRLAQQRPVSPPGGETIYHAVTFGWLVGEVACRVAGKGFRELLAQDVSGPLGAATDMYIGIDPAAEPRIAVLEETLPPDFRPPDDSQPEAIPGYIQPLHAWMNTREGRLAAVPASTGIMTARSVARFYAAHLPGGVDGVELLPPSRVKKATERQLPARNAETAMRMSLGYQLGCEGSDMGFRESAFGHGGYGGAIGFADPEHGLAVAFTKNLYSKAGSTSHVIKTLRETLGIPQ